MKTFKEYLQEQRQIEIEEGLGRIIGSAIDTAASATVRGAGRAARAAGKGLGRAAIATGKGLGKAGKVLAKAPFKIAGAALGALASGVGGAYHGSRASDEKAARELGAQRERERMEKEQEKARRESEEAEHAEMRTHGFDPSKSGSKEGFRHWKVAHRGMHLNDDTNPDHMRAIERNPDRRTGKHKFYPGTVRPSSIR